MDSPKCLSLKLKSEEKDKLEITIYGKENNLL